ncbi:MAG: iron ABC transporter permease [Chitinophagales bacterium]|nr:iron ABC transporter permease [Chitinophagales bacterium]
MQFRIKHLKRDINQWSFYTMAIGLFVAIPVFAIVIYLFDGVGEMWRHIVNYFLLDYIQNSLFLLLGTGFLTFFLGISSAWIVSNYDFPFRRLIEWLLFLPLAIPSYIVAYAYVGLLGNGGSLITYLQSIGFSIQKVEMMNIFGLIWVLSFSLFPYVYASTRTVFKSHPNSIRETAYLLGASNRRYFFSVALPLASPAIIGGLFLVFMEVLNDYGAAKYYGINTFTTGIFRTWTALEDLQSAIYLSALLVVLVFLINSLVNWLRGKRSYAIKVGQQSSTHSRRKSLNGSKRIIYPLLLAIPIVFGLLLPIAQLSYWAMLTLDTMLNAELFWIALQSISVAFGAAFFILITALVLIFFSKWNYLNSVHFIKKVATIGYVIPGAIIGIGIIRSSQTVINFFSDTFHLKIGYLFYGSSVILIYAYVFRFLAVAYNPIEANTLKLGKYLAESSYLLGSSKIKTLFKIELPLLRGTIISAFLLVFIDILKELPLTLILKPYNLQTLAVKAYEYADDERVAEAALPALVLIFTITLMMMLLNYGNKKLTSFGKPANKQMK